MKKIELLVDDKVNVIIITQIAIVGNEVCFSTENFMLKNLHDNTIKLTSVGGDEND